LQAEAGNFSLLRRAQTGSGAYAASYPMSIGGSILGVKRLAWKADHSLSSRAEIKNAWCYTFTHNMSSWRGA